MKTLSIIIPAYNEGENLEKLLPRIINTLSVQQIIYEIIVVDVVPSLDNTQNICSNFDTVNYLKRIGGNDYGDAIITGFSAAKYDYIAVMDADGSHSPEELPKMLAATDDAEVIIASRYVKGGRTDNPFILIMLSLIVNIVYQLVLQLKVRDVSNSFRIYRRKQIENLKLECKNFDIVEEILVKLQLLYPHNRVLELPTTFKKRIGGESKRQLVKFAFSYLVSIYRILKSKYQVIKQK